MTETFPDFTIPEDLAPRYNIAPSQEVAVLPNNGKNKVEFFRWGLIPSGAKDLVIGRHMINARAETVAEKPSFRTPYRRRRCLILADGFYEWRQDPESSSKTPVHICLESGKPFAFAGLWDVRHLPEGNVPIFSCTVITTIPNALIEKIHRRMPVILDSEAYDLWLDPHEQPPDQLSEFLKPYPAEVMTAYPVSCLVNRPQNDSPDCILPLEA